MRSIHKSRGCWPPLSRHYSSVTWTRATIPHVFEREIPSIAPYLAQICQARRNHKNMHSSVLVKLGLQVFAVGDILYIQAGSLSSEPSPCSRVTIATESIDSFESVKASEGCSHGAALHVPAELQLRWKDSRCFSHVTQAVHDLPWVSLNLVAMLGSIKTWVSANSEGRQPPFQSRQSCAAESC